MDANANLGSAIGVLSYNIAGFPLWQAPNPTGGGTTIPSTHTNTHKHTQNTQHTQSVHTHHTHTHHTHMHTRISSCFFTPRMHNPQPRYRSKFGRGTGRLDGAVGGHGRSHGRVKGGGSGNCARATDFSAGVTTAGPPPGPPLSATTSMHRHQNPSLPPPPPGASGQQSQHPKYKYQEVVRNKVKRAAMPGHQCEQCAKVTLFCVCVCKCVQACVSVCKCMQVCASVCS